MQAWSNQWRRSSLPKFSRSKDTRASCIKPSRPDRRLPTAASDVGRNRSTTEAAWSTKSAQPQVSCILFRRWGCPYLMPKEVWRQARIFFLSMLPLTKFDLMVIHWDPQKTNTEMHTGIYILPNFKFWAVFGRRGCSYKSPNLSILLKIKFD